MLLQRESSKTIFTHLFAHSFILRISVNAEKKKTTQNTIRKNA